MEELGYRMSLLRSRKLQVILIWLSKPVEICLRKQTKILKNCFYFILPSAGEKGSSFNRSDKKDP